MDTTFDDDQTKERNDEREQTRERPGEAAAPLLLQELPPLGEPLLGGTFWGITTEADGVHYAVSLLPDREPVRNWKRARYFAERVRGVLPSRMVASMLKLRGILLPKFFWLSEPVDSTRAWAYASHDGTAFEASVGADYSPIVVRLVPLYQPNRDELERRVVALELRLPSVSLEQRIAALESLARTSAAATE